MTIEEVKRNLDLYLNIRYKKEYPSLIKEKQIIQRFINDWFEVESYCQSEELKEDRNGLKVYIVWANEPWEESFIDKIFLDEEKAKKYIENRDKMTGMHYSIHEKEIGN